MEKETVPVVVVKTSCDTAENSKIIVHLDALLAAMSNENDQLQLNIPKTT